MQTFSCSEERLQDALIEHIVKDIGHAYSDS